MPKDEERAQILEAIRFHTEVFGEHPRGWYTRRCSKNTITLAAEEGGFAYVADTYADDLPYWMRTDGRGQLIVPYTLDCNDMRFATPQGFNAGDRLFFLSQRQLRCAV
jgi:peptidoglycan/xylan/chitin deacetylase (PgdA/CDA1 family)